MIENKGVVKWCQPKCLMALAFACIVVLSNTAYADFDKMTEKDKNVVEFARTFAANSLSYAVKIDKSEDMSMVTVVVADKICTVYIPTVSSTKKGSLAPMVVSRFECRPGDN